MTPRQLSAIAELRSSLVDSLGLASRPGASNWPRARDGYAAQLSALDALLAELRQTREDAVACWRAWQFAVTDGEASLSRAVDNRLLQYANEAERAAELAGEEKG